MTGNQLCLTRPHTMYEQTFRSGFHELILQSDKYAWICMGEDWFPNYFTTSFAEYVKLLNERETVAPSGFVCYSTYWAIRDGQKVGRISMRHTLNEMLQKVGGHIGYIVRPTARNQGVATEMLKQILKTGGAKAIGRLLLTCDETNLASERAILKAGGVFEDFAEVGEGKPRKKRFWIEATKP